MFERFWPNSRLMSSVRLQRVQAAVAALDTARQGSFYELYAAALLHQPVAPFARRGVEACVVVERPLRDPGDVRVAAIDRADLKTDSAVEQAGEQMNPASRIRVSRSSETRVQAIESRHDV